ncbi:energy transducer TonB [Frateuria terrea]|uniref:TonB protein C-terminal n=1 Tax=Frateuria terrea TaxID=529704 RepID=A0A1H6QYI6_9GAMM|nr:energy transducer TonB [Frateuria terrea]SEI45267.1 TonB protein C-terminal [Frateuria terrea]SFP11004.1 TonB protein C-terminal [Frateuria terrea]
MKRAVIGTLLATLAMVAHASTPRDLESSAVVDGTLVLAKNGTVQTVQIKDEARYGKPIADMVRKAALQWLFYPVLREGQPVLAKIDMHVRVVLQKAPDGNYTARIKGATFGDMDAKSTDALSNAESNKRIAPRYPIDAARAGVQGTVYLALRIDRSGHVTDAVAEQVNLANIGPDSALRQFRDEMAKTTLAAARRWTYQVPTTGRLASQDHWTARVPVTYTLNDRGEANPDSVWRTYVPGPYTKAPWSDKSDMDSVDAVVNDDVRTEGAGPALLVSFHQG